MVGDREVSVVDLIIDTTASGIIGTFAGAIINIPGINRGSHSLNQVFKSGLTKTIKYG